MTSGQQRAARWSGWAACTVALAAALGGSSFDNSDAALSRIARYCQVSWRNAGIRRQEWDDCTQQVMAELLASTSLDTALADGAAPADIELKRAVWRTIKRHQRQVVHRPLDETPSLETGNGSAWADVEEVATHCLTDRQQQVIGMVRDGWQVHQIAEQLGIPHTHNPDAEITLCGLCGEVKGGEKCCQEGVAECPNCGLHKGSILCCSTAINGRRDVILCRNTMIYLRADASAQLAQKLEALLRPGGVLVLGKAERPAGARRLVPAGPCVYRRIRG